MKNIKTIAVSLLMMTATLGLQAQEAAEAEKKFDPSNAGNLYTQINTNFELTNLDGDHNTYGFRVNGQYAINMNHMFMFEVPVAYNEMTNKFGLSDLRVQYYTVAWRDLSKVFNLVIPFADISFPTGSFSNGLGTGRWSIGVGVAFGLKLTNFLSLYPGVSYVYHTTNRVNLPVDDDIHGVVLQFNATVKLAKRAYVFVNPILSYSYKFGEWHPVWAGELSFNYVIKPSKFKVNAGWYPNFTNELHQVRVGATFYF